MGSTIRPGQLESSQEYTRKGSFGFKRLDEEREIEEFEEPIEGNEDDQGK